MPVYDTVRDQIRVRDYYEDYDERSRLTNGAGLLEFARLQEIIGRYAAPPPAVVLDVGGGPGRYSCWLARLGYEVHLIDLTPRHLEQAREASASQPDHPLTSVSEGDARSLAWDDESIDLVLLMGPLYHLLDREDRLSALSEARRVLKEGGVLVATAVNRFASLVDGLMNGYIDDPDFMTILHRDISDGRHMPDSHVQEYFTTAFFHRPEEMEEEVAEVGLRQKGLFSVQGPGEYAKDLDDRMADPRKREQLLDLVRLVEQERTLMGMASHFVVTAEK